MPVKSNKNSLQYQLSLVSAPEDFPPELSTLSGLDSALRCPVCKEFYQAPVIIHIQKCCHTFCSACIRTCFNNNSNNHKIGATGLGGVGNSQRCPICKVEAQEEKIKPVPTLESAVISWQDAREEIVRIIERNQSLESQLNELRSRCSADSNPPAEEKNGKQKKALHTIPQQQPEKRSGRPEPKTRAQKAKLKRKSPEEPAQEDGSDDGIEILDHNPTDPSAPVRCPICSTQMLNAKMDSHLTACLTEKSRNQSQSAIPAKKLKTSHQRGTKPIQQRIPLPHFASLKNKDIKTELSKHDLRSDGTTSIQMRRLSRYITLFNANLDSNPLYQKSLESLRKELYEWETLQDSENFNLDKNRRKIFSNQTSYLKSNHSQFASLIEQASKSFQVAQKTVDRQPVDYPGPAEPTVGDGHDPQTDSRTKKNVQPHSDIVSLEPTRDDQKLTETLESSDNHHPQKEEPTHKPVDHPPPDPPPPPPTHPLKSASPDTDHHPQIDSRKSQIVDSNSDIPHLELS
ncbi:hypothetical protein PtA15_3A154 [Puccinia triticina]|uniref:RING-type domain-containing protein n=1 Tax=Puccinia triticina TaxID=208348 RepID=A0ABY7CG18_9BASI|nr:uncharacterized protein PtA15_3A154 [Puccinia triticina]WAQ82790.1 hypothetical protein PtA15_3A154 [Puccinia triticina]